MKSNWIAPFIEGLESVVNVSGRIKGAVSSSVSEGMEDGFRHITPRLSRLAWMSGLFFVGILMLGVGLSSALESAFHFAGLGYLVTGMLFIVVGSLYYAFNK